LDESIGDFFVAVHQETVEPLIFQHNLFEVVDFVDADLVAADVDFIQHFVFVQEHLQLTCEPVCETVATQAEILKTDVVFEIPEGFDAAVVAQHVEPDFEPLETGVALERVEQNEAALAVDEVVPQIQVHHRRAVHQPLGQPARPIIFNLVVREVQITQTAVKPQAVHQRLQHVVVDVVALQFQLDDVARLQEVRQVQGVPGLHLFAQLLLRQFIYLAVLTHFQFN